MPTALSSREHKTPFPSLRVSLRHHDPHLALEHFRPGAVHFGTSFVSQIYFLCRETKDPTNVCLSATTTRTWRWNISSQVRLISGPRQTDTQTSELIYTIGWTFLKMWDHMKFTIYNIHQVLNFENFSLISKPTKPTKLTIQIIKCAWRIFFQMHNKDFQELQKHPNSPSYKQLHVIILTTITQMFFMQHKSFPSKVT
jgi:hypothetical protein